MLLTLVACSTASLAVNFNGVKSFSELGLLGATEQATLPPNVDSKGLSKIGLDTVTANSDVGNEGGAALT